MNAVSKCFSYCLEDMICYLGQEIRAETVRTDLSQIEEKQLKERGIPDKHILGCGFAFERKKVLIAGSKMRTIIVYGG